MANFITSPSRVQPKDQHEQGALLINFDMHEINNLAMACTVREIPYDFYIINQSEEINKEWLQYALAHVSSIYINNKDEQDKLISEIENEIDKYLLTNGDIETIHAQKSVLHYMIAKGEL